MIYDMAFFSFSVHLIWLAASIQSPRHEHTIEILLFIPNGFSRCWLLLHSNHDRIITRVFSPEYFLFIFGHRETLSVGEKRTVSRRRMLMVQYVCYYQAPYNEWYKVCMLDILPCGRGEKVIRDPKSRFIL